VVASISSRNRHDQGADNRRSGRAAGDDQTQALGSSVGKSPCRIDHDVVPAIRSSSASAACTRSDPTEDWGRSAPPCAGGAHGFGDLRIAAGHGNRADSRLSPTVQHVTIMDLPLISASGLPAACRGHAGRK